MVMTYLPIPSSMTGWHRQLLHLSHWFKKIFSFAMCQAWCCQELSGVPSQYSLHQDKLHLDYMQDYTELPTNCHRPMSFIIGMDDFNFMYLPHSSLKWQEMQTMNVAAGHMIQFSNMCLHSGGPNNSDRTSIWVFGYITSNPYHCPVNQVCKYTCSTNMILQMTRLWLIMATKK